MFYFKEIPRGSLLEHAILFRFEPSQISQQLRLGNQAHAPTQPDFSGTTYVPTSSSTRRVNSCIRGTLQSMDRATIHHLHDKSLHGFPHI